MEKENVIITSALPYSNGDLHLGHLASTYLPADIFARFMRMAGKNVVFACGGDDYGTPILIKAEKEGISPEEYVERWHRRHKEDFEKVGISFDIYYQTHSQENRELAQHFFRKIHEKGYIYKKEIKQFYCPNCKRFLPDRYIIGSCPYCGAENQYGDGCEVCGRTYEPTQLINPKCAVCGSSPVIKKTMHYFFKLSAFSEKLKEWLESNKNLQEDVKNYVLKWIEEGLKDWDITRDIEWGVPIPLEEAKGKVLYGWFENHLGYISFVLKYCKERGIDGTEFWNSSTIYHFIGKDIVYHHYLFMPAERMAEGTFKLPDYLPTRGHLLLEGKKFSKSRGWYISIRDFVNVFPADYLRYYMASIVPYSQKDVNFSLKTFQEKINNELVAAVGNFIHRVLKFLWEKFDGIVYAVFISLGFALVENILYVFGDSDGASVGILRAVTAVPAHALFGVVMGYHFAIAKFEPSHRAIEFVLALAFPILLHGLYDFWLMSENGYLLLLFIPYVIVLWIFGFKRMKTHSDDSVFKPKT